MIAAMLRFEAKPEHREAFIQAVVEHGRAVVPTEPGTLRFDLIVDQANPNVLYLYEAYAGPDAFSGHLAGASHQQLVHTLNEHDWLTTPLAGPPRPFAPFIVGLGDSAFTAEDACESGSST